MHCPFCNTINDDQNSFCVSCGKTIAPELKSPPEIIPPTQAFSGDSSFGQQSAQTAYPPKQSYTPTVFDQPVPQRKKRTGLIILLVAALFAVVGAIGAGAYFIWQGQQEAASSEVLPDHLGFFLRDADNKKLIEIKQKDAVNALDEREKLLNDNALTPYTENSTFILYLDAKDVPLIDLKLIRLDSLKDDGNVAQLDFQAVPVEGKPLMKSLRLPNGIADGKYAFALFNGFANDGNHKFWAFQVKDSGKSNNDDIARNAVISMKDAKKSDDSASSKPADDSENSAEPVKKKESKVAPPSGSSVAYCNGNDVLLRAQPSLTGKKIGKLSKGQRIYIMYYSENYDVWRGTTANWAYIQTESGGRGWVFTPFVYF